MSFLALASQKSLLNLRKSFLELQKISIQNRIEAAQSQMAYIERMHADDDNWEQDEDSNYQYYARLDDSLSTEADSLDSQLSVLQNDISSLKTLVNNNIKTSCTMNISGGGS